MAETSATPAASAAACRKTRPQAGGGAGEGPRPHLTPLSPLLPPASPAHCHGNAAPGRLARPLPAPPFPPPTAGTRDTAGGVGELASGRAGRGGAARGGPRTGFRPGGKVERPRLSPGGPTRAARPPSGLAGAGSGAGVAASVPGCSDSVSCPRCWPFLGHSPLVGLGKRFKDRESTFPCPSPILYFYFGSYLFAKLPTYTVVSLQIV